MTAQTLSPEISQWYKDAVIYELHVRAFSDSNADGIGDFPGLTERLDYLRDLGVSALWLLPFYPSPLRDDGYDIADYTDVHPSYGTLREFRTFLREAHRREIRVITELVVNHTSDQHPWFQRARSAPPQSNQRNFYVWSDTTDKYRDARIIFKDFEPSNWSWDPVAKAYYWHRFYSHQPDLNYDNPQVKKSILQVLDFWLDLGVDGLRLDAVPYLYERDGTNCENLPETHAFLRELRRHVDEKYGDRMLLAEANQWPEDAAAYFGQGRGDEVHAAFHFPLMPRLFMGIRTENRFPIIDILQQTPAIPETAQWLVFLRNHDELTLEMVTDEERDYMYRVYATDPRARINLGIRRRLAPLLSNDRRKIELMNGLLFSLPGTPVLYYGDEIGMGDNIYLGDRNGVRTPMHWSADRNAGFSRSNPQKLYLPVIVDPEYHFEAVNVEAQLANPTSLLWSMRQLIALRKRTHAFGRGNLEFLAPENRKILAFVRSAGDDRVLIVANLSRTVQHVELDLAAFKGHRPIELVGRTKFPAITESPYPLTLGSYDLYWLELEPPGMADAAAVSGLARVKVASDEHEGIWQELLDARPGDSWESALLAYMAQRRWFRGKARATQSLVVEEAIPLGAGAYAPRICLVRIAYAEGEPDLYLVPLQIAVAAAVEETRRRLPTAGVAQLAGTDGNELLLFDPSLDSRFGTILAGLLLQRRRHRGVLGEMQCWLAPLVRSNRNGDQAPLEGNLVRAEQSNTSYILGTRYVLKLFRGLDEGINPDFEMNQFLSEQLGFPQVPPLVGALEYRRAGRPPITLGIMQGFVPNEGDAWQYTLDYLGRYLERVQVRVQGAEPVPLPTGALVDASSRDPDDVAKEMVGLYLESARILGRRTGEMHQALASRPTVADFAPEPFSTLYQRSVYQSMRSHLNQNLQLLRRMLPRLPEPVRPMAEKVLASEAEIQRRYEAILQHKILAMRIRIHGDFHLGQVLHTGKDFVIIDFEGEPSRTVSERRLKRSPLRDVAGMLRSFHYAMRTAIENRVQSGLLPRDSLPRVLEWAQYWYRWVSGVFLRSYLEAVIPTGLLPSERKDLQVLLDAFLLDKAVYELGYELNNRPDWVHVPLGGILELMGGGP